MRCLLIVLDNESYIHYFPLATAYIASVLRKAGHDVTIYNQDMNHYPEEHLTRVLENLSFDLVGVGAIAGYYTYRKVLKISEAVNRAKNRNTFRYIIGGHLVSPYPEYFLEKTQADNICVGESEGIMNIIDDNNDKGILKSYPIPDLDTIPFPAYDLFPMWYYRLQRQPNINPSEFLASVVSGRGCYANCNFCCIKGTKI
jgi:radical SAM superfamily enzyme YgiQ (UPF0313 family)